VPSVSRLTNSEQYCFAEHLLNQISPQSDNKCGKYRFKFVYTPTWSVTDCQYTDFHKTDSHSSIVVYICCELQQNKMRIAENRARGLLTTWLSGHWLSHNSQWLSGMMWCSPVLNLTHSVWVEGHLCHEVKYNCHWAHFHETCTCDKISSKSDTQFNCWQ